MHVIDINSQQESKVYFPKYSLQIFNNMSQSSCWKIIHYLMFFA